MSIRLTREQYDEIEETANCLFEDLGFTDYPVDPFEVAERLMIEVKFYSEIPDSDRDFVVSKFEDGYGVNTLNQKYMIYICDDMPKKRVLFTLWLEIGHIQLGHYDQCEKSQALMNTEAKAFAKYCVAPMPFVAELKPQNSSELADFFNVSYECAGYIFRAYKNAFLWKEVKNKIRSNRITKILTFRRRERFSLNK